MSTPSPTSTDLVTTEPARTSLLQQAGQAC